MFPLHRKHYLEKPNKPTVSQSINNFSSSQTHEKEKWSGYGHVDL